MDPQQIITLMQSLTAAQIWLIIAITVFAICAVLTWITFRQFNQHREGLSGQEQPGSSEGVLLDIENCSAQPQYVIRDKALMIGRSSHTESDFYAAVVILNSTVGRRHAAIEQENGIFWLEDQGSVNGSYINGRRIHGRQALKSGDFIKIHKFVFQFMERYTFSEEQTEVYEPTQAAAPMHFPAEVTSNSRNEEVLKPNDVKVAEKEAQGDATLRLFAGSKEDNTLRLYAETLSGPPAKLSELDQEELIENMRASQAESTPMDIGAQVQVALGDFFSGSQEESDSDSSLELSQMGEQLIEQERQMDYSSFEEKFGHKSSES